jgi:hypothetical protein
MCVSSISARPLIPRAHAICICVPLAVFSRVPFLVLNTTLKSLTLLA